jgi:hypothetical protein
MSGSSRNGPEIAGLIACYEVAADFMFRVSLRSMLSSSRLLQVGLGDVDHVHAAAVRTLAAPHVVPVLRQAREIGGHPEVEPLFGQRAFVENMHAHKCAGGTIGSPAAGGFFRGE